MIVANDMSFCCIKKLLLFESIKNLKTKKFLILAFLFKMQATMQGLQGPQLWRLLLLLKSQCILYRRYGNVLEPFKYAGYPMLLNSVTVEKDDSNFLSSDRAPLLIAASELIWLT